MTKLRNTVIFAFVIIIAISLISSAVSFLGYKQVISSVQNIQINKTNQDRIQDIKLLSEKRHQLLSDAIISMSVEYNSDIKSITEKIDKDAKELTKLDINESDKKILNELIEQNSKYNDLYVNSIIPNLEALDGKSEKDLSRQLNENYLAMQTAIMKMKDTTVKDINDRLKKAQLDIASYNQSLPAIQSDAQFIHTTATDIDIILQNFEKQFSAIMNTSNMENIQNIDEQNNEVKINKVNLDTAIASISGKLKNQITTADGIITKTQSLQGFDRVNNANKIVSNLTLLNELFNISQLLNNKYALFMSAVTMTEDTNAQYQKLNSEFDTAVAKLQALKAEEIDQLITTNGEFNKGASELLNIASIKKQADFENGFSNLVALEKSIAEFENKLRLSFNTYLADDFNTSEKLKNTILWIFIAVTLFCLALGMLLAFFVSRKISNPIKAISNMLSKVQKGDLTARVEMDSKDELGEIGQQMNSVLEGQQKIVEHFRDTTNEISTLKQRLIVLVNQNRESVNKISGTIKSNQKKGLEKNLQSLDTQGIIEDVKVVSEETKKLVGDGIKVIEVAKSREKSIEEAEQVIKVVTETVKSIAESIMHLEGSSDKIGEITNTITQIASQTNLLALNAAIEANRAGKEGKGFAVVADEIRKLSNASNKSASDIKEQIRAIQRSINIAAEKMNSGMANVESGATRISEVREGISDIITSVNGVVEAIKVSAEKANSHYESTKQFVDVVEGLYQSVDESAASSGTLYESIQMQANTLKDLDQISQLLNEASLELKNIADGVKV